MNTSAKRLTNVSKTKRLTHSGGKKLHKVRCDSCAPTAINGVFCHERGCPNDGKVWDACDGQWYRAYECQECGQKYFDPAEAYECCSMFQSDDDDEEAQS